MTEIEQLKEENRKLRVFANSILDWSNAYPEEVFPRVSYDVIKSIAIDYDISLDRISAQILRDMLEPWGKLAKKTLEVSDE